MRAADYARRKLDEHLTKAADETCLICQIEDPEGADSHAEIAATDGVDELFIGRANFAFSYGLDDEIVESIAKRCEHVRAAKGAATGLYYAPSESLIVWKNAGASFFVVGPEHTLITQGATKIAARFQD